MEARQRRALPTLTGPRASRDVGQVTFFLHRANQRRWSFDLRWTRTWLFDDPTPPPLLIDVGGLEGFRDRVHGAVAWALPTDPNTHHLEAFIEAFATPLGTLAPDPAVIGVPNAARWLAGMAATQKVNLRRGALQIKLSLNVLNTPPDSRDLEPLIGVQPALLPLEGWGGLRLHAGLRYGF
ncbi:MAG: hypothetical protein AAGA48_00885 [Myxococcota bacterium]